MDCLFWLSVICLDTAGRRESLRVAKCDLRFGSVKVLSRFRGCGTRRREEMGCVRRAEDVSLTEQMHMTVIMQTAGRTSPTLSHAKTQL